jgi:hypothetical protein
MGLIGLVALVAFAVGFVGGLWWAGRANPSAPAPVAVPPPLATVALPLDPARVRIRYLDALGGLVGEQLIDRRTRRPEMHFHGAVFHAEQHLGGDLWIYRWTR